MNLKFENSIIIDIKIIMRSQTKTIPMQMSVETELTNQKLRILDTTSIR